MEIIGVNNITNTNAVNNKSLSIDDFLKIMAAEIKNQNVSGDESGGGSKTDYLTQMAQFSMLEQLNQIYESINQVNMLNQARLVGKEVKIYSEEGDIVGIVEKVKFANNNVYLQIDQKDYPIGLLVEVSNEG
ncbi:flagellar hook assembly protein [Soehngenia longivitae]|uniref:Flagellar hook assembly protein n=1 Tax=Soehngenia longivitae TaxID=2562294 RepID=A0A4Z0D5H3_9FIRM|nr:flagellar hook capping FlgD N-terminal domain-containing protein [Soehngenia longivitae]TFZ39922.1 flagellar hook assembly protein [Soehngenia longivitae]